MAINLDLSMPIVEKDDNGTFKATPYFEDYLFQIINSIGGEGAELDTSSSSLIASLLSKITKLEKTVEDLSQLNPIPANLSGVHSRIDNLEQLAPASLRGELSKTNNRLDDFEQLLSTVFVNKDFKGASSSTDNAIARWNGTGGKRLQDSGITIDDNDKMLFPIDNDAINPTIQFGDGDSGFYEESDDVIIHASAGVKRFSFRNTDIRSESTNGGALLFPSPSATVPSLVPNVTDTNTGIGWVSADILSLVAGGVEGLRVSTTALTTPNGFWGAAGISVNTGDTYRINSVTVLSATSLGSSVTLSSLTSLGTITSLVAGAVNTTGAYSVDGTQVVSNQGAAVADATDAASVILRLNDLLARLRPAGHGLIAS
jgi:hypothetical protein